MRGILHNERGGRAHLGEAVTNTPLLHAGFAFMPGFFELAILGMLGFFLVGIPVLILVLALTRGRRMLLRHTVPEQRISCPKCGAGIVATAAKCRFCGAWLNIPPPPDSGGENVPPQDQNQN